ncbi:MAG TPA: tetratricopeptide repeat protein [Thermoanaerobaculia bacterium]|jgi:Tfp pilus assembly protein PilF
MRRLAGRLAFAAALGGVLAGGAGCHRITKPKTSSELLLTERMAQVLLRDNQPVDAERAFREVLKYDSRNAEALDGLGNALTMQGRFKEAITYLDKAVSIDPLNGSFRNNRGVARMEMGLYQEAGEDFDAAESSPNPDDKLSASINRGRLRQRQGDFKAAEHEFSMALARDPKSFAALLGRAVARESKGDLEGAAEDYLSCVKIDSMSAEANFRLGVCLVSLKKGDLGRRYLQRAIDLDPNGDAGTKARLLMQGTPPS